MRNLTLMFALALALPALAFAGASSANDAVADLRTKEVPVIQETGIAAFDSVLMDAKGIHDTLDQVQDRIIKAQDRIAVSIGLAEGTPIRMSMWELKQRAGGPIAVETRDGKPYLTVGGTGSDEVKGMLAAVNEAAADLAKIPNDVKNLPPQVQKLVATCQAFPGQLNPQMLSDAGLSPLQLPKVAKTLANDVKAVVATPTRLENLVNATQDVLTGIPQGLAATEPPEQAVTVEDAKAKSKDKGDKPEKAKPVKGDDGGTAVADADLEDLDDGGNEAHAAAAPAASSERSAKPSGSSDAPAGETVGSPIGAMIADARAQLRDAEIDAAMTLLGQADASLVNLRSPIDASELLDLYETIALLHIVDGNAAAATASVTQALVVDPESKPITALGPEYAKLHKALAKSGIVHIVQVDLDGDGVAYISGHRVEGGATVYLATGKHLVQRQQTDGAWASEMVWVAEGTSITL